MEIGLLWKLEPAGQGLDRSVAQAAAAYRQRFGEPATVCFAHPGRAPRLARGEQMFVAGLRLVATRSLPPDHVWLAVNAAAALRPEAAA